jgi:hypothetical protein
MPESYDVYQARESFTTILDGEPVSVRKGARVRAGHPLLKGRDDLFVEEASNIDFEWDGPTPETRRGPGRPRKNPVG